MSLPSPDEVASYALSQLPETLQRLQRYLRIPAISCEAEHHDDVQRLAQAIRADLQQLGFEAHVRQLPGALPLVTACRWQGDDRPTLLVYGHLDLQPVHGEAWDTEPHEPTVRGDRLFARGAADDMGGWVSHLGAVEAWLGCVGGLPLNLKFVIESEEEIGSPNLERYMDAFPEAFAADAMVLTDCENPSTEVPGLTVSLRGLYEVRLSCSALASDIHSGLWGNMAPDPGNALIKLLGRLIDDDTRLALGAREVPRDWRERAARVPMPDELLRQGMRLLDGIEPLAARGKTAAEWLWRQPAVTVLSTNFPRADQHKNAIRREVSATLSLRVAPGQTRQQLRELLEQRLLFDAPGGVHVRLEDCPGNAESWLYEPQGPAFAAVERAYQKAWGQPLVHVGIGGSIPFVALFGRRFGALPLILNGVMDPLTGAHGPNESLHLGVFQKAVLANVHCYDELARALSAQAAA